LFVAIVDDYFPLFVMLESEMTRLL